MARPRVIKQDDILDAAEAVVVRCGAAHLTLDAVAVEARISKASVIYDYKTKQQLIKAVMERCLAAQEERIRKATEALGDVPSAPIRAMIAVVSDSAPDETRAVAANLGAALAQDSELRGVLETFFRRTIDTVMETSQSPRGALLAFLAFEGMRHLEWHNLHSWSEPERERIFREISWLVDASPLYNEPTGVSDSP